MVKPLAERTVRRHRGDPTLEKLRREILVGTFKPGAKIPAERQLADRLHTNRNTLREALRTLESENLIVSRQGDGTWVRDWRSEGEINLLPNFLQEDTPLDQRFAAVATLLQLRSNLLALAVRNAADHHQSSDVESLSRAIVALRRAGANDAVECDITFYRQLVLATHDMVLIWSFNTFAKIFSELGARFPDVWKIDDAYLAGLERVTSAIRLRRADRAADELARVFDERGAQLVNQLNPALKPRKRAR